MNILLIIFGILGGIIGGMGMGGGTITIPLLVLITGVEQHLAQFINLIVFLPMSIIALIIHFKNKLVNLKSSLIIIPALITAIIASIIVQNIPSENLKIYFGIFLIVLAILQSYFIIFKGKRKKKKIFKNKI